MSWTMRIGPSIQQFIVISKQHYLGYKHKFWKFFQDFRENHDEKDQRKEKSHWEYWYDSCLMNHVLWKHRIVGFRRRFEWFSDFHTSIILQNLNLQNLCRLLLSTVLFTSLVTWPVFSIEFWMRFRTKKTVRIGWFVVVQNDGYVT